MSEGLKNFIDSGKLTRFLADNLCDINDIIFVLQAILDAEARLKEGNVNEFE